MSNDKRIRLILLGSEGALKNALITLILGKELASSPTKTKTYENNMFIVIRTPDGKKSKNDAIEVFARDRNPDMSLLVVKDGCSQEEAWEQVDQLHQSTGKPTEQFIVLLPLGRRLGLNPFSCCTAGELLNKLSRMAEERDLMPPASNSHADSAAAVPPSSYPTREGAAGKVPRVDSDSRMNPVLPETSGSEKSASGNTIIGQESFSHDGRAAAEPPATLFFYRTYEAAGMFHRVVSASRVNLVLLGLSGSGKSASGNTILGQKIFRSGLTPNDVTTVCRAEEVELGARRVRVVDTPDIFDEDIECSTKARHARSCRELCQGNPTAFLLVMNISRFTDGERGVLRKLQDAFGSRVHEKTVILFTKGNDLKQSNLSFEEFLFTCHPELQKIVTKCGSRCVLFENRDSHSHQVQNLMQIVERMLN